MAIVKRESGSWKDVTNKLKQVGIFVNTQGDLLQLLDTEKIKHAESIRLFEQKKQEADKRCKDEIAQIFKEQENSLSSIRKEFSRKIRPVQDRSDTLKKQQDEVNEKGFFYKLFHLFEIISLSREDKNMKLKLKNLTSEKDDILKEQNKLFDRKRLGITQVRDDVIYDLKKEINGTERRVAAIEETLKSNDYYGAVAELKMISFLSELPDSYHVINDFCMKFTKSIRFNDEWISSVQIDHLVVSPFGIFIIEVKNWSKKFASEGNFHDPYNQVERYNRACYILLKDYFSVRLKNIIACAGYLPSKMDKKYTVVRSLENVTGYILWFNEQIYEQKTVDQIVKFFEGKINDAVS